jgi:hypothetical protein
MKIIQVMEGSEKYRMIQIRKNRDGSFVEVQTSTMILDLYFPQEKWQKAVGFLLYEPKTGLFWWEASYSNGLPKEYVSKIYAFPKGNRFILSNNKIIEFSLSGKVLWITDSNNQYATFEQARKSFFLILEKKLKTLHYGEAFGEYKELKLGSYINGEFFRLRGDCSGSLLPAKITDIKYRNSQWQVELEGTDNRNISINGVKLDKLGSVPRVKATVVLNDNYEVVEVLGEDFIKQIDEMME